MPPADTRPPEAPPRRRTLEPASNIAFTYASTGLDLLYLATTVLVFPRIADKAMFAEYRILILYGGYAGFLHFGILNGFYQESLHNHASAYKRALYRKARRLLLGVLLVAAPLCALVFSLVNPTASATTVAALLASWFLLNAQTLNNYATQTQGRFDRFFAYNCAGRCVGIAFVCLIAFSRSITTATLDISFLLPIAVSVLAAEAFAHGRFNIYATPETEPPGQPVTLHWRSCAHLYVAGVLSSLALSADKVVVAAQFERRVFADYSFAFSLSSLILYAGDGIATATLPLLLRKGATEATRRQSHLIWEWLYWSAPLVFWPASAFIDLWYPAYASSKPFLACFCLTLPAVIYCRSYCGMAAIAAKAAYLQSRVNLLGLATISFGIVAAEYYSSQPLMVCAGWCLGVFGWAALCPWMLGRSSEPRVRAELAIGLRDVALSSGVFGAVYYLLRLGGLPGAAVHVALAAAALGLPRLWNSMRGPKRAPQG